MPMRARLSRRVLAVCLSVFVMAVAVLVATSGDKLAARGEQQQSAAAYSEDDYGYGSRLSAEERRGRDTWYFWTGGNEKFWVEMARKTRRQRRPLNYVDSRRNGRRFRELGAITQPGCVPATAADEYGLWFDRCDQPAVRTCPASPAASSACASSPIRSSTSRSGTPRSTWPTRPAHEPPYLDRDVVRLLPHRLQPAQPARRSRTTEMVEPDGHHRQPVLGRRDGSST